MELTSVVTVTVDTTASVGPVTYPTPTTWSCTLTGLVQGTNSITATAVDSVGNRSTATASIALIGPTIGIDVSTNVLDTSTPNVVTIFFTVDVQASVNLKIIPERDGPTGAAIYQASQTCPAAGAYFFTWDGKTGSGQTVPDEAYLYILEATDGNTSSVYSPAKPTGTVSITCTQGASCDPASNIPLVITCSVPQPAYVTLEVNAIGSAATLLSSVPKNTGQYAYEWDCKDPNGAFLTSAISTSGTATPLYENTIITKGNTPEISSIKIDPYAVNLSFGNVTRISYTLSRDANVQVRLKSPSGETITILPAKAQTAGEHTVTWDGKNATDTEETTEFVNNPETGFIVSEPGYYSVTITAVNALTGTSTSVSRTLFIGQ
jgi:flagellar hook assembly protein FlgD